MNKRSRTTSGRTRPGAACNFPQPALLIKKREEKERERSPRNRISVTALGRGTASSSRRMHVPVNAANMIFVELHFVLHRWNVSTIWFSPRIREAHHAQEEVHVYDATCVVHSIFDNLDVCERAFSIFDYNTCTICRNIKQNRIWKNFTVTRKKKLARLARDEKHLYHFRGWKYLIFWITTAAFLRHPNINRVG